MVQWCMTMCCYDSAALKGLKDSCTEFDPVLWSSLKELGINKHTIRGKRAGTTKQRDIKVRITSRHRSTNHVDQSKTSGVNKSNLTRVYNETSLDTKVTIGCVNVRSLRNKTADFIDNIMDDNYDLCMITETWLDDTDDVIVAEATPTGFVLDHLPRVDRTGGGVGLLCRQSFRPQRQPIKQMKTFEYCEWTLKIMSEAMLVVVVYRPPYSEKHPYSVSDFVEDFSLYLETVITLPYKIIIGGDFNIHTDIIENDNSKKFGDMLTMFCLSNHVQVPTHIGGHTLDLFITRDCDEILVNPPELRYFISDHRFLRFKTIIHREAPAAKEITFRRLNSIDMTKFKEDIMASDLNIVENKNVHEKAAIYDRVLAEILDSHAPKITKTIRLKSESPWYNSELRSIKKNKRKAERKWLKSKHVIDFEKFKEFRMEYLQKCNLAKTTYYNGEIHKCDGNQRKLYSLINKLTNGERRTVFPETSSDQSLSEDFSEYFVNKIDNIMTDIERILDNESIEDISVYEPADKTTCELSNFRQLTQEETLILIKQSKTKSSILDPIPTSILKQCVDVLISPITDIVNSSLREGVFPNGWKCPVVTPLLKKPGLEPIFKNYRPVSNLPYISKIIEKAGLLQYTDYLVSNDLSTDNNSAYKASFSTETLLVKIHSDVMNAMDQQKITMLILVDLSAAFDTVKLDILTGILQNRFNINGNVLNWISSYLTDRGQRIKINDTISSVHNIKYGVPQGSVAGPVIFLAYLSSLYDIMERHLPEIKVGGYADDHQLYLSYHPGNQENEQDMINRFDRCISDVRSWMLTHYLKINDSKTECMFLGTKQQLQKADLRVIRVGQAEIEPSPIVRNLGVIFDQQMTMINHVNSVTRKGFAQLKKIRQIRSYLDQRATESIVHSFVSSNIDYCNALLYGAPKYVVQKLQRLQNAAARVVCGLQKFDHIAPALKSLHWLPVSFRIDYKIALLTFKSIHNLAPDYLVDLIDIHQPTRSLRSSGKMYLRQPRSQTKTLGPRAFSHSAPKIWNELPEDIRCESNADTFKCKLKTHYFTEAFR